MLFIHNNQNSMNSEKTFFIFRQSNKHVKIKLFKRLLWFKFNKKEKLNKLKMINYVSINILLFILFLYF
jgi:hypothetical protein